MCSIEWENGGERRDSGVWMNLIIHCGVGWMSHKSCVCVCVFVSWVVLYKSFLCVKKMICNPFRLPSHTLLAHFPPWCGDIWHVYCCFVRRGGGEPTRLIFFWFSLLHVSMWVVGVWQSTCEQFGYRAFSFVFSTSLGFLTLVLMGSCVLGE